MTELQQKYLKTISYLLGCGWHYQEIGEFLGFAKSSARQQVHMYVVRLQIIPADIKEKSRIKQRERAKKLLGR